METHATAHTPKRQIDLAWAKAQGPRGCPAEFAAGADRRAVGVGGGFEASGGFLGEKPEECGSVGKKSSGHPKACFQDAFIAE